MSAYIQFFIKANDDLFIPIGTFCRSHILYTICTNAPWEAVAAVTPNQIHNWLDSVEGSIGVTKDRIAKYQEQMRAIATFNDSIDEKLEAIHEIQSYIEEENDDLLRYDAAIAYLNTLLTIIDANRYEDGVDINQLLYYGVEVSKPTAKDIVTK